MVSRAQLVIEKTRRIRQALSNNSARKCKEQLYNLFEFIDENPINDNSLDTMKNDLERVISALDDHIEDQHGVTRKLEVEIDIIITNIVDEYLSEADTNERDQTIEQLRKERDQYRRAFSELSKMYKNRLEQINQTHREMEEEAEAAMQRVEDRLQETAESLGLDPDDVT